MANLRDQVNDHLRTVEALRNQLPIIESIAEKVIAIIRGGGKVFIFGNGGSAADAQHIAAELLGRFKRDRRALPAIALTTDSSSLTAIANDLGAEEVFRRQVQGLVEKRDVVWALSVSGKSPNVLKGLDAARKIGAVVIGFTSRSGGTMAEYCDFSLKIEADSSDRVQEAHQLAYHLVCDRVDQAFSDPS